MCGIVGYATTKNKWDLEKFFKQALIADVLRGADSTGVVIGNDRTFHYTKRATHALDFLDMKTVDKLVNSLPVNRPTFMIGHNRSATVGTVTTGNAHPFHHGDICGVHNGTLRNYWKLDRAKEFGTDSEALYFNLSRGPVDEVLSNVTGAYALVWWDNAKQTVNIIRNDERPLALAKIEGEETLVWASEAGMLRWIAARNGLKVENIIEPKPNVLITIHLDAAELSTFEYNQLEVKNNYPFTGMGGNVGGNQVRGSAIGGANTTLPAKGTADQYNKDRALQLLGINLRSTKYPVYVDEFDPYVGSPEFGQITAWMMVEPWLEVKIKAVPKMDYEKYKNTEIGVRLSSLHLEDGRLYSAYCDGYILRADKEEEEEESFVGPDGKTATLQEMYEYTTEGCMLCRTPIARADFDYTDFVDGKPICPDCVAMDRGGFEA